MLAESLHAAPIVQQAAARARRLGRPVLASWTRPCAAADPIASFSRSSDEFRSLWLQPERNAALVALGNACVLEGSGAGRFEQVSTQWRDVLRDALIDSPPGAPPPIAFGGFSFDPLQPRSALWQAFPDAQMVVPAQLISIRQERAWLTTNVLLDTATMRDAPPPNTARPAHEALSRQDWESLVGSVSNGIRRDDLKVTKIVLARAEAVRPRRPIDAALRHLAASYPGCTTFAVARDQSCFLGATPERLIALHGGVASTIALAGSAARGQTPAEDEQFAHRLLTDPKERAEHQIVVDALRDGMAQVCARVVADAEPRLQRLGNVQHLLTRIRGSVRPGRSVFDLVEHLHPTPAVGGHPRQPALELIRAREALDRGWYAAPIGWMQADGEGEFVVGLRSGLVQRDAATLFAGCGIVADSDPAAEAAEWGWKVQPMLAALGIEP
jgi:isochorismate synthase